MSQQVNNAFRSTFQQSNIGRAYEKFSQEATEEMKQKLSSTEFFKLSSKLCYSDKLIEHVLKVTFTEEGGFKAIFLDLKEYTASDSLILKRMQEVSNEIKFY